MIKNSLIRWVATLLLAAAIAVPATARELPKPQLMAVYFYATWCPNCKILSPQLEEARKTAKLDRENILFVTLDLSGKDTIHQSILTAQALGIGDFLKAQGSATGYVAVLDAASKKELTRFDSRNSSQDIQKGFATLLKAE